LRPALPSRDESWARRLTQSPKLGVLNLVFPLLEGFG
jgi:hypothetical protein